MLTIIQGNLGKGKTLYLTMLAKHSTYPKVISNYHLNFDFEEFSLMKCLKGEYMNATICLDEIYTLIDARDSMSNQSKALSSTLLQSRKKNVHMIGTLQMLRTMDVRWRELIDKFIEAKGLIRFKGNFYYKYIIYEKGVSFPKYQYWKFSEATKYYALYNTNQVINKHNHYEVINEFKTPEEKIKDIKQVAQDMLEKYPNSKITLRKVEYYLFKHKLNPKMKNFVYQEINEMMESEENEG